MKLASSAYPEIASSYQINSNHPLATFTMKPSFLLAMLVIAAVLFVPALAHAGDGHDHGEAGEHSHTIWGSGHGWAFPVVQSGDSRERNNSNTATTDPAGQHRHAAEGGNRPHENRPPYYALAYIMYTGK